MRALLLVCLIQKRFHCGKSEFILNIVINPLPRILVWACTLHDNACMSHTDFQAGECTPASPATPHYTLNVRQYHTPVIPRSCLDPATESEVQSTAKRSEHRLFSQPSVVVACNDHAHRVGYANENLA